MIPVPPRAKLSNPENGDETISPTQHDILCNHRINLLPTPPVTSQSSSPTASLIEPTNCSSPNVETSPKRPFLYSTDSPMSGSTLCPTPQSPQEGYENKELEDILFKNSQGVTSFEKTLDRASYTVDTLLPIDDAGRIAPWKRRLYRLSPFTTLISMVVYFSYYTYRIHCTLDAQRVFNQVYIMAWVFICAEGCVACEC